MIECSEFSASGPNFFNLPCVWNSLCLFRSRVDYAVPHRNMRLAFLRRSGNALCVRATSAARSLTAMNSPTGFSSNVEVEKKFLPTALLRSYLNGTHKYFESVQFHEGQSTPETYPVAHLSFFRPPDKRIRDTYFDSTVSCPVKGSGSGAVLLKRFEVMTSR